MKNHNYNHNHNTHNLSVISSETCSYKNETNSIHSSYLDYLEGNKAKNEWAKLIKNIPNLKQSNNNIIDEEEIDITKNCYEKQSSLKSNQPNENDKEIIKDQNNITKNEKNKNIESRVPDYLKRKYHFLKNGIILRDVNKENNSIMNKKILNAFLIQKEKGNNNNDNNSIKNNFYGKLKILEKKTPFQIKCIKKPDRSFITKIIKSTRLKPVKIKKFKKIYRNSSSLKKNPYLINNTSKPGSEKLIPIPKRIINKLEESKKILKKVERSKKSLIDNNNTYNKVSSSTISPKKLNIYSYKSLSDGKTDNNYLIINNKIKKRPTSSVTQEIIDQNNKNSKNNNSEVTSYIKSSYNNYKTRPISSIMNSKNNKNNKINIYVEDKIIYDNENFIKELNELKECFKSCDSNNNLMYHSNISKKNSFSMSEYQINSKRKNRPLRKSNSERIKNDDFYDFHPIDIIPLHNMEFKNSYENEKQNKGNLLYKSFEYKKHFGNESICPICATIREQNQLREEKCSNKYHYFPFKDKYETINSQQNSISINNYNYINNITSEQIFKNTYNTINLNNSKKSNLLTAFNPFYLNNIYNSPKKTIKNIIRCKIKYKNNFRKNRKYNVVQKYFE